MNVTINPKKLSGEILIPPSKSVAHRMIICAALAKGVSVIENIYPSKDILATLDAMRAMGAKCQLYGSTVTITGITSPAKSAVVECCESGSTLRFLIPVACALGIDTQFVGSGKLPQRPITPYLEQFPIHNVTFDYYNTMPFSVSGKLTSGVFEIGGDISSQFITGLLFALPFLEGDSEIVLTSPLQSKPYVDITIACLEQFGCVDIYETDEGYFVKGNQTLTSANCSVEGDYSQAAFFVVANSLGSNVKINGLEEKSSQGDKKIVEICENIVYNNNELKPFKLDCSDIPDLVPILAVLGCKCKGKSVIYNAERLRIKECDRLFAISHCLNKIGGKVTETADGLEIEGVEELCGGEVDSFNDHRIPMAMAIASTMCSEALTITDAGCVSKSYPTFWEDIKKLGGDININ